MMKAKNPISIFIVDDNKVYLKTLENYIANKIPKVKIKTFETGEACLQQMILNPDVVILDYFLDSEDPHASNGLAVLKQIRKTNPNTKVIMLSAQDSLDIASKCLDNGACDYISKSESAFIRVNYVLFNIVVDKNTYKGMSPFQIISLTLIILWILSYFLITYM